MMNSKTFTRNTWQAHYLMQGALNRVNPLHTTRNTLAKKHIHENEAYKGTQTEHWTPWWILDIQCILCINAPKKVGDLQNQA